MKNPNANPKPLPPSARTVTVACKIPSGLALQLQKPEDRIVAGRNGDEKVRFNIKGGKVWLVRGPAYPVMPPKGYPKPPLLAGGFALTPGIPAEFWEEWLEQNKQADYVLSGMIFAYPTVEDAQARAEEEEKSLSGLEPISTDINPKTNTLTDHRIPRPMGVGIGKLAPDQAA